MARGAGHNALVGVLTLPATALLAAFFRVALAPDERSSAQALASNAALNVERA